MLSEGPRWQGSAQQTLRNARAEVNLQRLADKMFKKQSDVRERRRYKRLFELNYDTNWPRNLRDLDNPFNLTMRPRSLAWPVEYPPMFNGLFFSMYPMNREFYDQTYAPGMSRMRDVARRIILMLRAWIRKTLCRKVCTQLGQRFFVPVTMRRVER
jgi:hypothetical protein